MMLPVRPFSNHLDQSHPPPRWRNQRPHRRRSRVDWVWWTRVWENQTIRQKYLTNIWQIFDKYMTSALNNKLIPIFLACKKLTSWFPEVQQTSWLSCAVPWTSRPWSWTHYWKTTCRAFVFIMGRLRQIQPNNIYTIHVSVFKFVVKKWPNLNRIKKATFQLIFTKCATPGHELVLLKPTNEA